MIHLISYLLIDGYRCDSGMCHVTGMLVSYIRVSIIRDSVEISAEGGISFDPVDLGRFHGVCGT